MLSRICRLSGVMLVLMCFVSSSIFALDHSMTQSSDATFEKIYVKQNDVMVTADGIFFVNSIGEVAPTSVLAFDSVGLYVLKRVQVCLVCREPLRNGVCVNQNCGQYKR